MNRTTFLFRFICIFIITTFCVSTCLQSTGYAQVQMVMPQPGQMLMMTSPFTPSLIQGVEVDVKNPFQMNFLVNPGDRPLSGLTQEEEYRKLIKYFMAALTIPDDHQWVNLSPYEGDRIIGDDFGQTEMGRDLLSQDYILKQLTASLMYPEDELGQKFWDQVYKEAYAKYGAFELPVNTFSKVWIVPEKAYVYEKGHTAWLVSAHLKVMLEEDYVALEKNRHDEASGMADMTDFDIKQLSGVSAQAVREVIIPAIEREVNEGEHFALLRQIYHSMVMATWYKRTLKESLLGQVYADQAKTAGIELQEQDAHQKIYDQYVGAFRRGVYDYIKEDYDPISRQMIPRKYFSGGFVRNPASLSVVSDAAQLPKDIRNNVGNAMSGTQKSFYRAMVDMTQFNAPYGGSEAAMLTSPEFIPALRTVMSRPTIKNYQALLRSANLPEGTIQEVFLRQPGERASRIRAAVVLELNRLSQNPKEAESIRAQKVYDAIAGNVAGILQTSSQDVKFKKLVNGFESSYRNSFSVFKPLLSASLSVTMAVAGILAYVGWYQKTMEENKKIIQGNVAVADILMIAEFEKSDGGISTSFSPFDIDRLLREEGQGAVDEILHKAEEHQRIELQNEISGLIHILFGEQEVQEQGNKEALLIREIEQMIDGEGLTLEEAQRRQLVIRLIGEDFLNWSSNKNIYNNNPDEYLSDMLSKIDRLIELKDAILNLVSRLNEQQKDMLLKETRGNLSSLLFNEIWQMLYDGEKSLTLRLVEEGGALEELKSLREQQFDEVLKIITAMHDKNLTGKYSDLLSEMLAMIGDNIEGLKSPGSPAENASLADPSAVGGIDLDSSLLDLNIKRDGEGVPLPLEFQDPAQFNVPGLTPVILDITPVAPAAIPILSEMMKELEEEQSSV